LTPALARNVDEAERGPVVTRRLRRSLFTELAALTVVLVLVAVMTNVRPGRDYVSSRTASPPAATSSRETVVLAAQDRDLAVGLGITRSDDTHLALRATVLGPKGPVSNLGVNFVVDGARASHFAAASACGRGCYQATAPAVGPIGEILLDRDARTLPDHSHVRFAGTSPGP
jgi:hypothetical protein